MKQKFNDITLNGQHFPFADLMDLSNKIIQSKNSISWEITLYKFILDWISESPTIRVKTSGSTGKPKTIFLEKEKMIQSALRTGSFFQLRKNDKALLCLPVDFIAGKMMVVRAFVLGLNLFPVEPKANPLDLINDEFRFAAMTPMQVSNIFNGAQGNHKLNNIQTLIVGGGEISPDLIVKFLQLTNNTWNTYGMTETITHVALKKLNGIGRADCFEALPKVSFEQDERECLTIHAPYLSKNPIQTNDIVQLISNTKFEFLGRYDNMINTGGIKVSPEKVEKRIQPYFEERIVISSIPDGVLGQKVILIVEGQQNENSDIDVNNSKANLSKFESPKSVFYLDKFPETVNGKVNRKKLAEIVNIST